MSAGLHDNPRFRMTGLGSRARRVHALSNVTAEGRGNQARTGHPAELCRGGRSTAEHAGGPAKPNLMLCCCSAQDTIFAGSDRRGLCCSGGTARQGKQRAKLRCIAFMTAHKHGTSLLALHSTSEKLSGRLRTRLARPPAAPWRTMQPRAAVLATTPHSAYISAMAAALPPAGGTRAGGAG